MRKVLYSVLLMAAISFTLYSCSSGAYSANPSSAANNTVNPLNPLTASQFTWTSSSEFSANVNGSAWVTDSVVYYIDTEGANIVIAYLGNQEFSLYLKNTWANNLYNMGHLQYNTQGDYEIIDSTSLTAYTSILGNSGELYMTENDTAYFSGKFYFQGVTASGQVVNVSDGYFKIPK